MHLLFIIFNDKLLLFYISMVYLISDNFSSSNDCIKKIKRREKLIKKWAFPNSKIKVFDAPMTAHQMPKRCQ